MNEKKSFLELVSAVPTSETKNIKIDRFPGIEWQIRAIGIEELKQVRAKFAQNKDQIAFAENVCIMCMVNPEDNAPLWKNANELAKAKVTTPVQLLNKFLRVGEIESISADVLKFSGFESVTDIQEKVKSF
jgi:hypothetical protein